MLFFLNEFLIEIVNFDQGIVKFGAVNADEHMNIGSKYGIKGIPTIKIFGAKDKPEDYAGPRTAEGIVDAVLNAITSKSKKGLGGSKVNMTVYNM